VSQRRAAIAGQPVGEVAVLPRCREALPCSQRVPNSVAGAEVAGAYVLKAAYRRAESDPSALDIGGRKSREAAKPRGAKSVTAWPFPVPRGAARLTGIGRQRRRRQRGGAYVRKAVHRRAESGSAPLNIGERKSREANGPSRGAKSVKSSSLPLPRSAAMLTALASPHRRRQRGRCVCAESSLSLFRKRLFHAQHRRKEES
jgi:hypothetical protein